MGKRFNIFVSDEAWQIVKKFQKEKGIGNLDDAVNQFILNNAKKVE